MAPILDFIVNFLLVNSKIYKIMSHKIFQTQKGVNFTLPKTYPYMILSNNTNDLAVLAVCKNFIMMAHFLTSGITVKGFSFSHFKIQCVIIAPSFQIISDSCQTRVRLVSDSFETHFENNFVVKDLNLLSLVLINVNLHAYCIVYLWTQDFCREGSISKVKVKGNS